MVNAKKIQVKGNKLFISTWFRDFIIVRGEILGFRIYRVPSFFEEIGIELHSNKVFLVTERVTGFLDLANFLGLAEMFGPLWYRDAENGKELRSKGREFGEYDI